jgi:predicted transcriptional regulator
MGLNPTEILLLAEIMEYDRNTGDFFKSDEALATEFGVSEKTISRAVTSLVEKGLITKKTTNVKGGRSRHIYLNHSNLEAATKDKMSIVNETPSIINGQNDCCTKDNLSIVNGQNDFIKNKEKDNLKIKTNNSSQESGEEGSLEAPIVIEREWLAARINQIVTCANGLYKYGNKFYKIKEK